VIPDALVAIEWENPLLKGVRPKYYACPGMEKHTVRVF
jgi:hypothetical protein